MIKKILQSEKGAGLVQTMFVVSALIGGALVLSGKFQEVSFVANQSKSSSQKKYAMSSMLSYGEYLLVNRMCVDRGTGLMKPNCNRLTDPDSLERLILLPSTVSDLRSRFKLNFKPLSNYTFTINAEALNSNHPAYQILQKIRAEKVVYKYKSDRKTEKGKVVKVKIDIEVFLEDETNLKASKQLELSSTVLNKYALVLNRNLVVGAKGKSSGGSDNDTGRPVNVINGSSNNRISFKSPVFVNEKLVIPSEGTSKVEGVDFFSRVDSGEGLYKYGQGSVKKFSPAKNGVFKLYSEWKSFDGLHAGINEKGMEESLAYIFAKDYSGVSLKSNMSMCIEYSKRRYDSKYTKGSRLLVKKNSENELVLGLTKLNEFIEVTPNNSDWKDKNENVEESDKNPFLALNVDTPYGDKEYLLGDNYTVKINAYEHGLVEYKGPTYVRNEDYEEEEEDDSGEESGTETGEESGTETGEESGTETGEESGTETGEESGTETGEESGTETGEESGTETGEESGTETGEEPGAGEGTGEIESDDDDDDDDRPRRRRWVRVSESEKRNNSPILVIKAKDLGRLSQRGLTFNVDNANRDFEWRDDIDVDVKVFNLRTPSEGLSSEAYARFSNFIDSGWQWDGPNRKWSMDHKRIKLYANNSVVNNTLTLGFYGQGRWSQLSDYNAYNMNRLVEYEKDSLGDDPIKWDELCEDTDLKLSIKENRNTNEDYSKSSFLSWNYNPISKTKQYLPGKSAPVPWSDISTIDESKVLLNSLYINSSNQNMFHVYSVVDRCIVDPSADHVFGFLVCRQLIIKPRSKELNMVGTFVVDMLDIPNNTSMNWYNVYNPAARPLLEKTKLLPTANECKITRSSPVWSPNPTSGEVKRNKQCSPFALTRLSDPFTWSSFRPSCGLKSADSVKTTCNPYDRSQDFTVIDLGEKYEEM